MDIDKLFALMDEYRDAQSEQDKFHSESRYDPVGWEQKTIANRLSNASLALSDFFRDYVDGRIMTSIGQGWGKE